MNILNCTHCGNEFTSVKSTAHYCSNTCRHAAWRIAGNKPTGASVRACASCGNNFNSKRINHMYCSSACAKKSPTQYDYIKRRKESNEAFRENRRTLNYRWASKNIKKYILSRAKRSAASRNLEFNITIDDIELPENMCCPVLGIPIKLHPPTSKKVGPQPDSISLDRVDNTKGYIKGNVVVVSDRANRLKNNATVEELEAILQYMKRRQCGYDNNI